MEIYCGEKSTKVYGKDEWLPDETLHALREYVVSIKGPLTTPVGGGIRSLKDIENAVNIARKNGCKKIISKFLSTP